MNKQIRELEQQSGIEIYGLGLDRAKWEYSLEKFAQLIVQSCIKNIEDERYKLAESLDTEYDDGYVDGMYRAEYKLREHFGVEE